MKKLFLLLVPVVTLMVACNNKPASTEPAATTADTSVVASDSTRVDTTGSGTADMPAQVWEEKTGLTVAGATITAKDKSTVVESVTSDEKGMYAYAKLTEGKTYTFTATKTGYLDSTYTAPYKGSNTLPNFPLRKKQ